MYKTYKNCFITNSDCIIINPWIDDEKSDLYKSYGGYHTGLDIRASSVYNWKTGIVTHVGIDKDEFQSVTVQYSAKTSLRYMHLCESAVVSGEKLSAGALIGYACKFVHFEYISPNKETSIWPVRIGTITYYKHDPEAILNGDIESYGGEAYGVDRKQ